MVRSCIQVKMTSLADEGDLATTLDLPLDPPPPPKDLCNPLLVLELGECALTGGVPAPDFLSFKLGKEACRVNLNIYDISYPPPPEKYI